MSYAAFVVMYGVCPQGGFELSTVTSELSPSYPQQVANVSIAKNLFRGRLLLNG